MNGMNVDHCKLINELKNEDKFLYEIEDIEYQLIENLITKRKNMNLTQKDIASITGMSQQAVSRIEKYGNKPSLTNLIKYMRALNLDLNVIFS